MKNKRLFYDFQNYVQKNIFRCFSNKMLEKFEVYFNEINEWNNIINLISFKDDTDLIYRHFCDSLYSAKVIIDIIEQHYYHHNTWGFKVADIGTGVGMPGIPVKIILSNIKLTLIESIKKKCEFLKNMKTRLGLDITILNERAEDIGQNKIHRQQYDFVLSRAVSNFSSNLEFAIPLLKINGFFIIHKTKQLAENNENGVPSISNAMKKLKIKLEQKIFYNLPGRELDYCILIFKKYENTPMQFPRKKGIPEKRPL